MNDADVILSEAKDLRCVGCIIEVQIPRCARNDNADLFGLTLPIRYER